MMRLSALLIFSLLPIVCFAQDFSSRWVGHFSYANVKDIESYGDDLIVAAENAVYRYNLSTKEIQTFTTIQGLSGEFISTIHYYQEKDLIFVGYQNGLINIIKTENGEVKIRKVVDIFEKKTISPDRKTINHFLEEGNKLYISTDYGISVFDLDKLEFGDTYYIGDGGSQIKVAQTAILDSRIYAVTEQSGIKRAEISDNNLIDYRNWTLVTLGSFKAIERIKNELYVASTFNQVSQLFPDGNLNPKQNFSQDIRRFKVTDNKLAITTKNAVYVYSEGFINEEQVDYVQNYSLELEAGIAFGNKVFLGTVEHGILAVPYGSATATQILPNGPIRNRPFGLDASSGQLWVVFGETTIDFNPYPLSEYGISQLTDSTWFNISYKELKQALNGKDATDIMKVTINPANPDQAYMSSFQKGLLKIENKESSILYDETNSPLTRINLGGGDAGIRLYGSDFDREGNFWVVQSKAEKGLIKLTPSGEFKKYDLSRYIDPVGELALTKLAISKEGFIFFGAYYNGLLGFDPRENRLNKIGENPGNGNLPSANVRALAIDAQNRIWIGTLRGLRILHSPASFFEAGTRESQPIIIMENGVAQELLYQQSITAIKVDGSNNKWIATASSGVFYVSANGQETLLRFTKDNSPLPTNNVQDIAIDPDTGMVYFATTQGLVAYKGTATAPRGSLARLRAFPNPVRPEYQGVVTIDGLTSQANVKITDISGNLVFETTSQGGSVQWDTRAFGRYKVRSGVYLIMVTTEDDRETKVAKVMIVR